MCSNIPKCNSLSACCIHSDSACHIGCSELFGPWLVLVPGCSEVLGCDVIYGSCTLAELCAKCSTLLVQKARLCLGESLQCYAGSKPGDFCTWCWCGPCALCQETRTLWTNNVDDGTWYGPVQFVKPGAAAVAPLRQHMSAGV